MTRTKTLTDADRTWIEIARAHGGTWKVIADAFGVSPHTLKIWLGLEKRKGSK